MQKMLSWIVCMLWMIGAETKPVVDIRATHMLQIPPTQIERPLFILNYLETSPSDCLPCAITTAIASKQFDIINGSLARNSSVLQTGASQDRRLVSRTFSNSSLHVYLCGGTYQ